MVPTLVSWGTRKLFPRNSELQNTFDFETLSPTWPTQHGKSGGLDLSAYHHNNVYHLLTIIQSVESQSRLWTRTRLASYLFWYRFNNSHFRLNLDQILKLRGWGRGYSITKKYKTLSENLIFELFSFRHGSTKNFNTQLQKLLKLWYFFGPAFFCKKKPNHTPRPTQSFKNH